MLQRVVAMEVGVSEKRSSILNAALELFSERGYDTTSVKDVVDRAEVSLATFYRYFDGKRSLLRELAYPRMLAVFQALIRAANEEPNPVEKLLAVIRAAFVTVASDAFLASLFRHRLANRELEEEFERIVQMMDNLGVSLLNDAQEKGLTWLPDPPAAVAMIRCVIEGWFTWERNRQDPVDMPRLVDTMENILRAALRDHDRARVDSSSKAPRVAAK
jgi:AcrR family transcriptional regulator